MVSSYSTEVINSDEFSETLRSMHQHTNVLEPYLWQFTRKLELKFPSKIFLSQYIQPPGCSNSVALILCCTGWAKCQAEFYIYTSANAVEFEFLTKLFKKYSLDFSLSLSYFFFFWYTEQYLLFLNNQLIFFFFFNWLTGTSTNYCICCLK